MEAEKQRIRLLTTIAGLDILCEVLEESDNVIIIKEPFKCVMTQHGLTGFPFSLFDNDSRLFRFQRDTVSSIGLDEKLSITYCDWIMQFRAKKSGIVKPVVKVNG